MTKKIAKQIKKQTNETNKHVNKQTNNQSNKQTTHLLTLQHTHENRASSHTTLEIIHLTARTIHIEAANDNQTRRCKEVAVGDRDFLDYVLADDVNVVFQLR